MGWLFMSKKILVPVKNCISFAEDRLFERARKTLQAAGIQFADILEKDRKELDGGKIIIPTMDSVFFHQDRFEVLIDARGFRPEELKCTISPNVVEVVAQKQENVSASNRSMSLTRNYRLPQRVKPEEGICCLSSEGILLITAPWWK